MNCLLDKIKPITEGIIRDYQGDFYPNRSTTDQIFLIRPIFRQMWKFNKDMYVIYFVDFKPAYDFILRASLVKILRDFKLKKKTN